jgi:glutamyl-tRNA synthetase
LRDSGVSASAITGYLAWRAGLQDSPRPCPAQSLVNGFAFASLPATALRLPEDIARVLRELG